MAANLSIHSLERYLDERMSPGRDREHDLTLMQRATGVNAALNVSFMKS